MAFDKSKFLAANQAVSSDNPFPEIEPGFYIATLDDANLGNAKSSGRYQATFIWAFDECETKLFGKKIASRIGLENDENYKALNGCLYAMGVSQAQLVGEFAENPDAFLERLVGTKARLEISKNGDFTNTRVKKLISSPLKSNGDNIVSSPALQTQQPVNTLTSTPAPTKEITISVGMLVLVNKNGVELPGKIMGYQEATNEVLIKYDDTSLKAEPVSIELVRPNPNAAPLAQPAKVEEVGVVEEIIEEVKEPPKLEVGMQASGTYEGKQIHGEIYKIEGDIIKLKVAVDGKFKAFPCPKGSIVVNVPF